ncbi:MAG: hypothetical protein KatS3mg015_2824 [Fimbriimonadales bacterium]|nr:MAG: hypothetical protein KatS3mg015_2824 [Fimbriimonadales bacterium]
MALSREQKKLIAIRRAERRLLRRLEDIDWELDELLPEVRELAEREAAGEIVNVTLELGRGREA